MSEKPIISMVPHHLEEILKILKTKEPYRTSYIEDLNCEDVFDPFVKYYLWDDYKQEGEYSIINGHNLGAIQYHQDISLFQVLHPFQKLTALFEMNPKQSGFIRITPLNTNDWMCAHLVSEGKGAHCLYEMRKNCMVLDGKVPRSNDANTIKWFHKGIKLIQDPKYQQLFITLADAMDQEDSRKDTFNDFYTYYVKPMRSLFFGNEPRVRVSNNPYKIIYDNERISMEPATFDDYTHLIPEVDIDMSIFDQWNSDYEVNIRYLYALLKGYDVFPSIEKIAEILNMI